MKTLILPVAAVALLTMCTPSGDRTETGAVGSRDTAATERGMEAVRTPDSAGATTSATAARSNTKLDDGLILARLDQANTNEVRSFSAAAKTTSNPELKRLANKIATEHKANRGEGRALAKRIGVKPSEAGTAGEEVADAAADAAAEMKSLAGKTGRDFDKAFLEHQVKVHEETIDMLKNQFLPAAQNAELKTMIQRTIPKVQGHLTQLKKLEEQVKA
jgi:putative membrane protein